MPQTGDLPAGAADAPAQAAPELDADEKRRSGALMRVNHVGEVCAQALYQAQALATANVELKARMARAAREEIDHLAWTEERDYVMVDLFIENRQLLDLGLITHDKTLRPSLNE